MSETSSGTRAKSSFRRFAADASRLISTGPRRRRLLMAATGLLLLSRGFLRVSRRHYRTNERRFEAFTARLPLVSCTPEEASWALSVAAHRLPGTLCLAWALAFRAWLSRMGIPSVVRYGVARPAAGRLTAGSAAGLAAHAWVEAQGRGWSFGDAVENYEIMQPSAHAGMTGPRDAPGPTQP